MDHKDDGLRALITEARHGVVATLKRDGRPQLSTVGFTAEKAAEKDAGLLRFTTTADRAKVHNLRRDPRVSVHVTGPHPWAYAVAEGAAELSDVATAPGDPVLAELVEVYRAIGGEHPDWDDYRRAMVADRRLVVRIRVDRVYGIPAT
ncbi:PPOX class probable F420-dependent enzyme [Murinocardiopsis flavida]|uniref:PPOX class probable F420-dependent enzyme n=1 Tax=Murinocardiopsis flavida TaxID=645275 RepID=A0A2P8DGX7_9ACTN|nr:PPOX class F420-dependent oxidoreductase [Murinocardiopsis flavida]PSK96429.1 PPOX class probable F420-dependent enzyme [Murinocardiopsis flavida]